MFLQTSAERSPCYIKWSTGAQFYDHEKLSLVLNKVSDILHQIKKRNQKSPYLIFFSPCVKRDAKTVNDPL